MTTEIPFNRALPQGREIEYIQEVIAGGHLSGNRSFSQRCQELLEEVMGAPKVILTPSCTHALEMCSLLLGIGEGDEVIIPSFTFVSTANAFALHGARPVFCDIRPDTLNMDENHLNSLITPRTKAIVPVHYAGVGCEMDRISAIANQYDIPVVEDNAHGLFGQYREQALGTFGSLATQSFHETKNLTCGEGGALVINDPALVERAEIISEKGTDRSRFFRGMVDRYTWVDVGSSYLLAEILAAFLLAQMEARHSIQEMRWRLWESYYRNLSDWAKEHDISLPFVPAHCHQAYHMFYILLPGQGERQSAMDHLRDRGISAVFHYQPLHNSAMGRKFGGQKGDCPVTENVSDRLLRLPFHNALSDSDQDRVMEALRDWREAC